MSDCSNHKKEVAGVSDMKVLAEMIGDLHYDTLMNLLFELSNKIDSDAVKDHVNGREKLAAGLLCLGASIFESSLRCQEVWQMSKPFMCPRGQRPPVMPPA